MQPTFIKMSRLVNNRDEGFFCILRLVYCLEFYLSLFEMATLLCSFFRLSAVAIIRLDVASGVSSSDRPLLPTYSK